MLRGNGGQDIFRDDADLARFCVLLQYASEKHQLNIHGFCLMENHVHFVIQPCTSDLTAGMHSLAFRYAQYFNKKYKRRGYLYQGRYKAVLVQSDTYLRRLVRYIHLNPVRARIVRRAEEYRWSSHRAYMGSDDYTWLNRTLVLDAFGGESSGGVEKLSQYTEMNIDEARDEAIEIRKSLRMGAYGDDEFLKTWRPILSEEEGVCADFHLCGANEVSLESITETVCCRLDMSIEDIRSDKRTKHLVQARTVMASLILKLGTDPMTALGRYISRDPTSLSKPARKGKRDAQVQNLTDEVLALLLAGDNR